jgi:hypothetical protein
MHQLTAESEDDERAEPKRASVDEVEEKIFPVAPAAADELAKRDAFADAEPGDADQNPLPGDAAEVLRKLAVSGEWVNAAAAIYRREQQKGNQERRVPPGSKQSITPGSSRVQCRRDLCVGGQVVPII